jgi:hypothetical protein
MVAPPPFRFVAAALTALCLSTAAWADDGPIATANQSSIGCRLC